MCLDSSLRSEELAGPLQAEEVFDLKESEHLLPEFAVVKEVL